MDKGHPYGHGKVEPIAAAFVGVTLVFAAIMIVKGIVESIITHTFATPTFLALGAAVLSIAVKETMYRFTNAIGKKIGSEAIKADAWHHRSDAFSSIGTLIGISGSIIGRWLGIGFLEYLDPVAGAVVACFIFKVAYDIIRHAVKGLMDASPDDEKMRGIREAAAGTEGIRTVNKIKGRYVGRHLFIDMEIEVDSDLTVEAGARHRGPGAHTHHRRQRGCGRGAGARGTRASLRKLTVTFSRQCPLLCRSGGYTPAGRRDNI